jgi:hypothetical protein
MILATVTTDRFPSAERRLLVISMGTRHATGEATSGMLAMNPQMNTALAFKAEATPAVAAKPDSSGRMSKSIRPGP